MGRAIAYIRASKFKEDGISPELQFAAIDKHCTDNGHTVLETVHDLDLSGRLWKTRQIERVVQMIENKEADVLVVWKISRVARNMKDWVIAVDRVEGAGGTIESATEHFDRTITGGFARGLMAQFADYESKRIGESWKETQARRIKLGLPHTGTPRFGYAYSRETGYVQDPDVAEALKGMYLDYIAGAGFAKLAHVSRAHGGPAEASGVKRMMDSGFAAGLVLHRGQVHLGAHEPIIDEVTWQSFLRARRRRADRPRAEMSEHPYSGIIKCACGSYMGGNAYTQRGVRKTKYGCQAYRYGADHTNSIIEPIVEETVLRFLEELAADLNERADAKKAGLDSGKRRVDPRPKLRQDLAKVIARLDNAMTKYLDGEMDRGQHERLSKQYRDEKTALEDQLAQLDAQEASPRPAQLAANLLEHWDSFLIHEKRELLSKLLYIEVPQEPGTRWSPKAVRAVPLFG